MPTPSRTRKTVLDPSARKEIEELTASSTGDLLSWVVLLEDLLRLGDAVPPTTRI